MRGKKQEYDTVFAKAKATENIQKLQELLHSDLFNHKNAQLALEALNVILETDLKQLLKPHIADTEIQKIFEHYHADPQEFMKDHIGQLMMQGTLDNDIGNDIINKLEGKHIIEVKTSSNPHQNPPKLWSDAATMRSTQKYDKDEQTKKLTSVGQRNPRALGIYAEHARKVEAIQKQLKEEQTKNDASDKKTFK